MSVLVIGADGLVGRAVTHALKARRQIVHATTRRPSENAGHIFLDLAMPKIEEAELPDAETAILCAAVNGFARCRAEPQTPYQVNVEATEILARLLAARGCRVILLSSSAVFDFRRAHVPAESPLCPATVYGRHKAVAEERVRAISPRNTIVRLTKVLAPDTSRFAAWLLALKSNTTVRAFSDLHFCPISLDYTVRALIAIMDKGNGGVYQVSGTDDISYAAAARHLAKRMGKPESCVIAELAGSHGIPPEEVARFTSLDSSRATALTGECAPEPFGVLDAVFDPLIHQLLGT